MTLGEWSGAVVEPAAGGSPPTADEWTSVDLPGSPPVFAGADCVAYRTTFEDPREDDQVRALLTLEGLYARSRVWLNGEFVGDHDTYFEPWRHVFEPEERNELVVECRPPDDRYGGVHDSPTVPAADAVPAVWWDATVEGLPPVAILEMDVSPRLAETGGRLDVAMTIDATRGFDDTVTFSLRPEGFRGGGRMEREEVRVPAGSRERIERTLTVDDPELWYPRGVGPQHRYVVAARLAGREVSAETGFRTLSYDEDDGFVINGVAVPARGFNVLPSPDPFGDVDRAVSANGNFLRAHAHVPPPPFHRACAEAGMLVWQDLPLTGPGGFDIDRGRELAGALHERLEHNPAVVAYGVHDDPREVFGSGVGGGRTGRARVKWRAWRASYNHAPDESVAEAFPDDVPVFPVSGPVGIDPDAAHLYPGWDYGTAADVDWLLGRYPAMAEVVAEFGAGALARTDVAHAAGFDREKHDARVSGTVEDSQAYQASVLRTVAEGLRRHDANAMAAFALRDTDDAGMGVVGVDGRSKSGLDAIARAYEPLLPVLDGPPSGSVGTTVLNDTTEAVEGTLAWEAGHEEGEGEFAAEPFEHVDGPTVTIPDSAAHVQLELSAGAVRVGNRYYR